MPGTFAAGERVKATVWGRDKVGAVVEQRNGLVWVQWDGERNVTWMHPESLALVEG